MAHVSAGIWWLVLLWAFHHLAFQIGALFKTTPPLPITNSKEPAIAILYATCDDFIPEYCQSCLDQDYKNARVWICDDSQEEYYQKLVQDFCNRNKSRCTLITRPDRQGFKAGNLNNAIENYVTADWILLVDADQLLPETYLSQFVSRLPQNDDIAFIQAAQQTITTGKNSYFQAVFSPEVKLYYSRDLSLRERFGMVPMLGHGVLIQRAAWKKVGGFPEVVSEDFAFSLRVASKRYSSKYFEEILSYEGIPYDFGGFVVRIKKFAKGTAELLWSEMMPFIRGPASTIEKWDFFMMLFWYMLMPLVTINGFLGAYVCYRLWEEGLPYLQPLLPYLYTWMLLSIFAISLSVSRTWPSALRFYFWATAIYSAAIPVAGVSFLKHFFVRPSFDRTPKNQAKRLSIAECISMTILGLLALFCSYRWLSPFTPILLGQGIAYCSYPLYGELCFDSSLGRLSRRLIYLPGCFMLLALIAMWKWGRY
jgi:cellulose synthase/poly-beta-1,6-N-acetylglucosamine synthase-like glycosyltransferase